MWLLQAGGTQGGHEDCGSYSVLGFWLCRCVLKCPFPLNGAFIPPLSPKAWGTPWKREENSLSLDGECCDVPSGHGMITSSMNLWHAISWTRHDHCTHELTVLVVTCTKASRQDQPLLQQEALGELWIKAGCGWGGLRVGGVHRRVGGRSWGWSGLRYFVYTYEAVKE